MGRAARTKHERREVARWTQAAELAQRADQAADHVIAHCLAQAFGRTGPLDLDALRSLRAQVAERTTWPSWSWLPNTIFVQNLLATNGIAIGQTNDAELEKYCRLAAAMTTVVNWLPGRTVVYYDVTLLESLASTPIEQPIPAQAFYRLPAWGLYLDLPWLAGGAGVFACLDPGPDLNTTYVLLTYTGVLADGAPLEIGEYQAFDVDAAQSEPGDQQDDRVVTLAARVAPVDRVQDLVHLAWVPHRWDSGLLSRGHRRDRVQYGALDKALSGSEFEKRAQRTQFLLDGLDLISPFSAPSAVKYGMSAGDHRL
jgi:hypothetical protein